jgi:hypothetical protein
MIHNHWLSITHYTTSRLRIAQNHSRPLTQHSSLWLTTTCLAYFTMIQSQSAQHSSTWFTTIRLSQWFWIMVCYAVQVVVNHTCYAEPVVANHGELCWASGCESCCAMLSRMVVNHVELCWADWLWIMVKYAKQVVKWHSTTHHDSQPLAQHNSPWFTAMRLSIIHHDS